MAEYRPNRRMAYSLAEDGFEVVPSVLTPPDINALRSAFIADGFGRAVSEGFFRQGDLILGDGLPIAVGVGASLVPQRSLALHARRHAIVRLLWPKRFVRELVVVVRKQRQTPGHIQRFVENILF